MVEYPIQTLVDAGITDVVIVTGGNRPGQFLEYLKDGSAFGLTSLALTYQKGNGGVADALRCARPFIPHCESVTVILGDNYFEEGIAACLPPKNWHDGWWGARCILKETDTPWDFGIAEVSDNQIISIEEKPNQPKSNLAIVGGYFFDFEVWEAIEQLKVSDRGELEITDVLKQYMSWGRLGYEMYDGYWSDMGTFENWMAVSQRIANK